jgi:hypothetical protein
MRAKIVQCHYFVCRFFSDFDTLSNRGGISGSGNNPRMELVTALLGPLMSPGHYSSSG